MGRRKNKSSGKLGRPLRGEKRRVRVSYTLDPAHEKWVTQTAALSGQNRSQVIETLIANARETAEPYGATASTQDLPIFIPVKEVRQFARKHHIRRLSLFGSVLCDDFDDKSDVDVLAEFAEESIPSLFELISMEKELADLLGDRKVDLRTPHELSRYFRDDVQMHKKVIYED